MDETSFHQHYGHILPSEYEVVKENINQLLGALVIHKSNSPFASPIVLAKKKDGSLCLCMDYWQINNQTSKDAFPFPLTEESLDAPTGACWFPTIDLASGYNKVPVLELQRLTDQKQPFALCHQLMRLWSSPPSNNIKSSRRWCCRFCKKRA